MHVEWVDAVRPRRDRAGTEPLSIHSKARHQLSRKLAAGQGTQSIMQVLEASNSEMRVQVDELGRLPGVSARPSHASCQDTDFSEKYELGLKEKS